MCLGLKNYAEHRRLRFSFFAWTQRSRFLMLLSGGVKTGL